MGLNFTNQLVNVNEINCDGVVRVTLAISAFPDILKEPIDVVLVLDRSGSMRGEPLNALKEGAKQFVDILDKTTDTSQDGIIGGGSRVGMVSFSTNATKNVPLTTNVEELKSSIDSLVAANSTNHADAFQKAIELFDKESTNNKIIIMFTDGYTTAGGNANSIATLAKSMGISVYAIGLGDQGISEETLNQWASDPDYAYVTIAPTYNELTEVFRKLAENVTKTGATNIVINEVLNQGFVISELFMPTKGVAEKINDRTLKWSINELGTNEIEGASLSFLAKYIGGVSTTERISELITYTDAEGNVADFQNPEIKIDCGIELEAEQCPKDNELVVEECKDEAKYDLGDLYLDSTGKILEANLRLKSVCPNKRVALAVMLTEKDELGIEYKRGMKVMTIPAHEYETCKDVNVRRIKFILPDDISTSPICEERRFNIRAMAHYIDHGYDCTEV